jgi:Lrp/AsnC family leucine-responsive transcriptional regulator
MLTLENEKLLDATGWQILCALQEDARLSYSELGRRVGLSLPAVAERVHRLEDAGIITGYRAQVNTAKLGYPIMAFIRMSLTRDRDPQVSAIVREMPEILECHRITGSDCFVMRAVVSSVSHLETLIDRLSVYGELVTSIVLSSPVTTRTIRPTE